MSLKFPNARLYVHELLALRGLKGGDAILQAAFEFGLISHQSMRTLTETLSDGCHCQSVVKRVLEICFEEQAKLSLNAPLDAAQAWQEIERRCSMYLQPKSNFESESGDKCNCLQLAPILFDLLLQQIRRYF